MNDKLCARSGFGDLPPFPVTERQRRVLRRDPAARGLYGALILHEWNQLIAQLKLLRRTIPDR
jgi:hypothetical protein